MESETSKRPIRDSNRGSGAKAGPVKRDRENTALRLVVQIRSGRCLERQSSDGSSQGPGRIVSDGPSSPPGTRLPTLPTSQRALSSFSINNAQIVMTGVCGMKINVKIN